MKLNKFIAHEIRKSKGDTNTIFVNSSTEIKIDQKALALAAEIDSAMSKKRTHGRFANTVEPSKSSYFAGRFFEYIKTGSSFDLLEMTEDVTGGANTESLKSKMEEQPAATGGHVLFLDYNTDQGSFFLVCMLNNKIGHWITIKKGVPEIVDAKMLSVDMLDIACRIDKSMALDNKEGHLVFVTPKKSNHYFAKFIGCTDIIKPETNSKQTVQIINMILKDGNYDNAEDLRQKLYDYACGKARLREDIDVREMAAYIFGEEKKELVVAEARKRGISIDDIFSPVSSIFKSLIRVELAGDWVDKIEFDRKMLRGNNISVDNDMVTIKDKKLAEEVERLLNGKNQ